jgi:hypothetical protein
LVYLPEQSAIPYTLRRASCAQITHLLARTDWRICGQLVQGSQSPALQGTSMWMSKRSINAEMRF